jgi:hypothetical protein
MKGDDLYPMAQALAAVRHGGRVDMAAMDLDEEVGYLVIANAIRKLLGGYGG